MTPTFKEDNSKVEERYFKLQLMFGTIRNSLSTQRIGAWTARAEETQSSDAIHFLMKPPHSKTLKGSFLCLSLMLGRKENHTGLRLLRAAFNVVWTKVRRGEDITGQHFIHTGTKIHGNKWFSTQFQSTLQCYFRIKLFFLFWAQFKISEKCDF